MACEIMWENDEGSYLETPRARWERMRKWIVANLADDQPVFPAESGLGDRPGNTAEDRSAHDEP